jgi:DEAD/DEAH box helicase domain-containing protein
VELLKRISELNEARFLAFGDSRKMVERIVAATFRQRTSPSNDAGTDGETEINDEEFPLDSEIPSLPRILPYRAGYEAEDRREIQFALSHGGLSGVVATSALELGLDIGEIRIVLLLNSPPSVKSLLQRLEEPEDAVPRFASSLTTRKISDPLKAIFPERWMSVGFTLITATFNTQMLSVQPMN